MIMVFPVFQPPFLAIRPTGMASVLVRPARMSEGVRRSGTGSQQNRDACDNPFFSFTGYHVITSLSKSAYYYIIVKLFLNS